MVEKRVILITGASGFWGLRVAEQLAASPEFHVIGLDREEPDLDVEGLDFIRADIRNPLIVELLHDEEVDTVCHLNFISTLRPRESAFDNNVMGTMKLLGACAEAGVRKVVLKSSTAVYGAQANNSAFLSENHPLNGSRSYGYTRDMVEIEAFCNGFRRQYPEITFTILRFASILGPRVDSPLTQFLRNKRAPVLLGFDPMMQVIHDDDVVGALVHAVVYDKPGIFNVAAEGIIPLIKLMRLAGKPPIPVVHLFAYWGINLLAGSGVQVTNCFPIEPDYIRYPWVGELEKMHTELEYFPRYTAEEAVREFAGVQRMHHFMPVSEALAYDEERLRDTLERRRRIRRREMGSDLLRGSDIQEGAHDE
jgi:UDP-glucose 4-epimerase